MAPCPDCGVRVEVGGGPHGLAWHECGSSTYDPSHDAFGLVARNAADPAATLDQLMTEAVRATVASAVRTGEMNAQSVGALLGGFAQVKQVGGTSTLEDLLGFMDEDEKETG